MASRRPFTLIAAILFGIMAVIHAYRLVTDFQIVLGSHMIPMGVSWIAVVATAALSIMLFREARR